MRKIHHSFISASDVDQFSSRDKAFMINPEQFASFMSYKNSIDSAEQAVLDKKDSYPDHHRNLTHQVLKAQYDALSIDSAACEKNLVALKDQNTFAIITAHQPCLMTGPLYFIYKIASTIKLAQRMSEQHTNYHFVPIYVIGSEDHDFEEINHLNLYGNRLQWSSSAGGAVGRMRLNEIEDVVNQVEDLLGQSQYSSDALAMLRASYRSDRTLAEATAHFVYSIFSEYGIIVADMDDKKFKQAVIPFWEAELQHKVGYEKTIQNQDQLKQLGFDAQIYPRPINLFHLDQLSRTRIEVEDDEYIIDNQRLKYNDLQSYLINNPVRFSPNVALRPLYQQSILPGVAYIGGGAEVAYWMEVKGVFDAMDIPFPMIIRRDSATWIQPHSEKLIEKIELSVKQLFQPLHQAQTDLLKDNFNHDWTLDGYKSSLRDLFVQISNEVNQVDAGLDSMIKGFQSQQDNFLNKLENKMKKSLKSQHDVSMKRMEKVWSDLFPGDSLQERKQNFLSIYSRIGPEFIHTLVAHFDPLTPGMHIFQEKDS